MTIEGKIEPTEAELDQMTLDHAEEVKRMDAGDLTKRGEAMKEIVKQAMIELFEGGLIECEVNAHPSYPSKCIISIIRLMPKGD